MVLHYNRDEGVGQHGRLRIRRARDLHAEIRGQARRRHRRGEEQCEGQLRVRDELESLGAARVFTGNIERGTSCGWVKHVSPQRRSGAVFDRNTQKDIEQTPNQIEFGYESWLVKHHHCALIIQLDAGIGACTDLLWSRARQSGASTALLPRRRSGGRGQYETLLIDHSSSVPRMCIVCPAVSRLVQNEK